MTDLASGALVAVASAGHDGQFLLPVVAGDYAFAATAERGSVWIEKQPISDAGVNMTLTGGCKSVSGRVTIRDDHGSQVNFGPHTFNTGDTFIAPVRDDGSFSACLPTGDYTVRVTGGILSTGMGLTVAADTTIELGGYLASDVRTPPRFSGAVPHKLVDLVGDIVKSDAQLVGLGEATHGSAEFVARRAELMFALVRQAQLRLLLLENDAIDAMALERYVNGEPVDLVQAVAALGFWTTDTYEFIHLFEDIRTYNLAHALAGERIHVWGIDAQDTKPAVTLVISNAGALQLSADEQSLLLSLSPDRGKAVKQFTSERRAVLDALLARLSTPMSASVESTQLAIAARSLAIQVHYLDGDTMGLYASRRDAGMAALASFIFSRAGSPRACLWAHDDHISRFSQSDQSMGQRLANAFTGRYYPVGFYFFEGSSRAWDAAAKIGVISHALNPALPFTVEGAVMAVTGSPDIAWLPLRKLPAKLSEWLATPRFARELGAVYGGEERSMLLLEIPRAFDALVVIKDVHDSSPTPTGVRRKAK